MDKSREGQVIGEIQEIAADKGALLNSMVPFPMTGSWLLPPNFGEFPFRLQPIF